jgi:hypothetical protein
LPSFTSHLISIRPDLLHRENATGRTPLEVASDMYLSDRVNNSPSIANPNSNRYMWMYGDGGSGSCDITKAAPATFLPKKKHDDETRSTKRTYEICVEAAKKSHATRKLVSLFEANEVAKRLAGRKARILTTNGEEVKKEELRTDEVTMWLNGSL